MGRCAAASGGPHVDTGSYVYQLALNMANFPGRGTDNWRRCLNCMELVVDGAGQQSPCPASPGAKHVVSSTDHYALATSPASGWVPWQTDWKQCQKCGALAYIHLASVCAKDGKAHDFSMSKNYMLVAEATHYNLSFTCHEVGHCFGFMHSHGTDNSQPYGDSLDMMGGGPQFQPMRWSPAGPGMSGASLFREGWLPSARVWTAPIGAKNSFPLNLAPVNHPELPGYLLGRVVLSNRIFTVEFRNGTGWDQGLKTSSVFVHDMQTLFTAGQNGWRYCAKCNGLHYKGAAPCPYGGVHDATPGETYVVPFAGATTTGQAGWKWCKKCQSLVIGGGTCTAAGQHDTSASANYQLPYVATPTFGYDWRSCGTCQALCYGGGAVPGSCPGGGWHDFSHTEYYSIEETTNPPAGSQPGWRSCSKCQSLFYLGASPCPGGGFHDIEQSDDYSLVSENVMFDVVGQKGWRWCRKCQGLGYAGKGSNGVCPAGGTHDYSQSGPYLLEYASSTNGQNGWRMCSQCQGLIYGNAATPGPCPAPPPGSQHVFGTDEYLLPLHGMDATYAPVGALTKSGQYTDPGSGLTINVNDIDTGGTFAKVTITTM